jgi:LmbE family N-acetylglucosaminyl deacetylase
MMFLLGIIIGLAAGAFIGAAVTTIAHWDASLKYRAWASQTIQRLNEQLTERNREHENLEVYRRHPASAACDVLGVRASGSIWAHHADGRDVVACNRRGSGVDQATEAIDHG